MTDIVFAKLVELPLREAWKHEALDFTPWLADNIDHLSDAVDMDLELTGTEVAVDSFSADILARNVHDGTVVLIENQLEATDHTHLGQIMTYLAGLDAQTVIWIAPTFRDAHVSAIRWLNENTSNDFSFLAVKAKVVRIGESPFAPIFELVEKPDTWGRALASKRSSADGSRDPLSDTRLAFWTHYAARHPAAVAAGLKPMRGWNSYFKQANGLIQVSIWIGEKKCGIYIRGGNGDDKFSARDALAPFEKALTQRLGRHWNQQNTSGHVFAERTPMSYINAEDWDAMADWLEDRRKAYCAVIESLGLRVSS